MCSKIFPVNINYFGVKAFKNQRKNNFLIQSFQNGKSMLNSRNKLFKIEHFKKIRTNYYRQNSTNYSLTKRSDSINKNSKDKTLSIESYEIKKINKNINELSGISERKKDGLAKIFVESYISKHPSRETVLSKKKSKNKFLIANRMSSINNFCKYNSNSKSIFQLTNSLKSPVFNNNHI